MNVLFIVHQFLPKHAAGTEIYTYHLARELQRRGHRVTVYATESTLGKDADHLEKKEWGGLPIWEAINNYEVGAFEDTYRNEQKEQQLETVLADVQPEIVHIQHLGLHSYGYVDVLARRGVKIVYTLHEFAAMCLHNGWLVKPGWELCDGPEPETCTACATAMSLPAPRSGGLIEAVAARRRFIENAFDKVGLFISPSEFLRDRFVAEGMVPPERILHSDNGFQTAPFAGFTHTPSETLRFGYAGTISEWKGIHLIVEAFNGLPEDGVECRIWGVLEYFPEYVARLRANAGHSGVRFLGRFEPERIADVLSEIDVLIVPSLWFENSPLTIHEAFLAGIPVVTADRGGMAELVEHGKSGLHFRLGDAGDLRRQLRRLIDDRALLASLRHFPPVKDIAADTDLMERRYAALLDGDLPRE